MKSESKSEHGCCYSETESIGCKQALKVAPEAEGIELKRMGSVEGKLLRRLLGVSTEFQESISLQNRDIHVGVPRNTYYNQQMEIKTALLEAERKKAKAIETQRRHVIF